LKPGDFEVDARIAAHGTGFRSRIAASGKMAG